MTQPYETSAIDTATINDLVRRVVELEERLQDHTGDAQGSSGQFYQHPIASFDTAEYGGGIMRLDNTGIQILGTVQHQAIAWVPHYFATTAQITTPNVQVFGNPGTGNGAFSSFELGAYPSSTYWATVDGYGGSSVNLSIAYLDAHNVTNASAPDAKIQCVVLDSGESYVETVGVPHKLGSVTADPSVLQDGEVWYRSDLFRLRCRINGITGNLGVEIQSASAPAIASNGTITTVGVSVARVAPGSAVTGIILAVGTTGGQVCTVVNESAAGNTVTFAASGTSNVADGTSSVIAGLNARRFVWDSGTSLWYPCK